MQIQRATINDCQEAAGLVVAIDVLRAFTTAAYLFDNGAENIILVSEVDEAFRLKNSNPELLLVGEVDGIQVPGFDFGNSPSEIAKNNFSGKTIVQRTTAGTQGVARAIHAKTILTAALTNISATVHLIEALNPTNVTLIQTGLFPDRGWGDEDVACADAIEMMLLGEEVKWESVIKRVRTSRSGLRYDGTHAAFPATDLKAALQIDRFNYGMLVKKKQGLDVLTKVDLDAVPAQLRL